MIYKEIQLCLEQWISVTKCLGFPRDNFGVCKTCMNFILNAPVPAIRANGQKSEYKCTHWRAPREMTAEALGVTLLQCGTRPWCSWSHGKISTVIPGRRIPGLVCLQSYRDQIAPCQRWQCTQSGCTVNRVTFVQSHLVPVSPWEAWFRPIRV